MKPNVDGTTGARTSAKSSLVGAETPRKYGGYTPRSPTAKAVRQGAQNGETVRESAQTSMAALGSTAALFDNKKKFTAKSNLSANRYAKVKVKKIIVYKTLGDNKAT